MRTRYLALGLAALVSVVPASLAQDPGKPAGTRTEAEDLQTHQRPGSNAGISLAVPIGRISVDPEFLDGEPSYVRRTTVGAGITIVEVSTTPFMPVSGSNEGGTIGRPDQPAGW